MNLGILKIIKDDCKSQIKNVAIAKYKLQNFSVS